MSLMFVSALCCSADTKRCVPTTEASKYLNNDICISAHIYDVVELQDGTQFLDTCPPDVGDADCRFTIVSLQEDRNFVGELRHYRDQNVQVRGIVRSIRGRAAIVVSHERQFSGGPPRFRPNPLLGHGFAGDDERPPVLDPNLRSQGGRRGFMNTRDQKAITGSEQSK